MSAIQYYDNGKGKPRQVSDQNPLPVVLVSESSILAASIDPIPDPSNTTIEEVANKVNQIISAMQGG